jgi:hypothetical protein
MTFFIAVLFCRTIGWRIFYNIPLRKTVNGQFQDEISFAIAAKLRERA